MGTHGRNGCSALESTVLTNSALRTLNWLAVESVSSCRERIRRDLAVAAVQVS